MGWNLSRLGAPALCAALSGCNLVVQTISEYGGAPVAGVRIQVNDGPWVETDAAGRVELPSPGGAYALRVAQPTNFTSASGHRFVTWDLLELDSPPGNPVVLKVEGSFVPHHGMVLSGTVHGASGGRVAVKLMAGGAVLDSTTARADGTFELPFVQWEGADGRAATLHVFEDDGAAFPAGHFLAHGTAKVTLTDSASATALVELHPVSESVARADISLPPGFGGGISGAVVVRFPDGAAGVSFGPASAAGPLDVHVPQLPGADGASLEVEASGPGGFAGEVRPIGSFGAVAFDLPAPVALLEPGEGAAIGPGTVFRWSPGASGGTYDLGLQCHWTDAGGTVDFDVNYRELETALTERALPAFPDVEIASGASCAWSVSWADADARAFSVARSVLQGRSSASLSRSATFQP